MVPDEVQDVLLADAMNVFAVPIMATRALKVVTQPAGRDPPLDLVVVLAQAHLQFTHRVAVSHAPRGADALQLGYDGVFGPTQALGDVRGGNVADQPLQEINLGA